MQQNPDLLWQGLELTLAGMGTVFVFLSLLVLATAGMSALIARARPPEPPADADPQELAAVASAVHRYRSDHETP